MGCRPLCPPEDPPQSWPELACALLGPSVPDTPPLIPSSQEVFGFSQNGRKLLETPVLTPAAATPQSGRVRVSRSTPGLSMSPPMAKMQA